MDIGGPSGVCSLRGGSAEVRASTQCFVADLVVRMADDTMSSINNSVQISRHCMLFRVCFNGVRACPA